MGSRVVPRNTPAAIIEKQSEIAQDLLGAPLYPEIPPRNRFWSKARFRVKEPLNYSDFTQTENYIVEAILIVLNHLIINVGDAISLDNRVWRIVGIIPYESNPIYKQVTARLRAHSETESLLPDVEMGVFDVEFNEVYL